MSQPAWKITYWDHLAEHHSDSVHIYIDGSKFKDSAGCAAFIAQKTIKYKLHESSTIFTAELYAIIAAISIILSENHNRNFTVVADSRSALRAIETPKTTHTIISFIQSWIIRLASRRKIIQFC